MRKQNFIDVNGLLLIVLLFYIIIMQLLKCTLIENRPVVVLTKNTRTIKKKKE